MLVFVCVYAGRRDTITSNQSGIGRHHRHHQQWGRGDHAWWRWWQRSGESTLDFFQAILSYRKDYTYHFCIWYLWAVLCLFCSRKWWLWHKDQIPLFQEMDTTEKDVTGNDDCDVKIKWTFCRKWIRQRAWQKMMTVTQRSDILFFFFFRRWIWQRRTWHRFGPVPNRLPCLNVDIKQKWFPHCRKICDVKIG